MRRAGFTPRASPSGCVAGCWPGSRDRAVVRRSCSRAGRPSRTGRRPRCLLLGPTGVGKTELVRQSGRRAALRPDDLCRGRHDSLAQERRAVLNGARRLRRQQGAFTFSTGPQWRVTRTPRGSCLRRGGKAQPDGVAALWASLARDPPPGERSAEIPSACFRVLTSTSARRSWPRVVPGGARCSTARLGRTAARTRPHCWTGRCGRSSTGVPEPGRRDRGVDERSAAPSNGWRGSKLTGCGPAPPPGRGPSGGRVRGAAGRPGGVRPVYGARGLRRTLRTLLAAPVAESHADRPVGTAPRGSPHRRAEDSWCS